MVGELLGDGSITFPGKRGNNARFVITIGIDNYPYLLHLRYNIYKDDYFNQYGKCYHKQVYRFTFRIKGI